MEFDLKKEVGSARSDLRKQTDEALRRVFELAIEQLDREDRLPVDHHCSPDALYNELGLALGAEGRSLDEVVSKLRRILAATPSSASPRYLNQLFGGRDPVAMLAEMLTPLTNTSLYTYKVAGPHVLIEREVVGRMAEKVGYKEGEGSALRGRFGVQHAGNDDRSQRSVGGRPRGRAARATGHGLHLRREPLLDPQERRRAWTGTAKRARSFHGSARPDGCRRPAQDDP